MEDFFRVGIFFEWTLKILGGKMFLLIKSVENNFCSNSRYEDVDFKFHCYKCLEIKAMDQPNHVAKFL